MIDNEQNAGPEGQPAEGSEGTAISKFKSAQDRDNAYLELEKKSRLDSQRLADLEAKLEQLATLTSQGSQRQEEDQRSFTDEYKSQDEVKKFWARFAVKPEEVFQERENQMMGRMMAVIETKSAVEDFKNKNPDLAKHEELVSIFVKKQPTNLSPAERLKKAAPEARKYLAELARSGVSSQEDKLDAETFVESPSNARESVPAARSKEENDDPLAEVIREHSARRAATMFPTKK